ncbi:Ig-like domain-containing protein, partial [Haliangium sp. UPWRP_2]|uniref:Ig-like domain-containing protein n=1 Tax=Haliangium sp. UPWRP_2 TaxID=1931276 RepID=UPI0018EC757F
RQERHGAPHRHRRRALIDRRVAEHVLLAKGTTLQLTATATFTDDTTQDITATAAWSATDVAPATNVASVTATGVATGRNLGSSTLTAMLGGKSGSATLTVTAALLTAVKVSPSTASIAKGTTQQFTATATFTDASTQDVTKTAAWTTTDVTGTGVTSVDANGLVTGKNVGTATIGATFGGKSDAATLTVTAAVVTSVTIAPKAPSIAKGITQQFVATAMLSDATTQDVTSLATWTTADVTGTGVASVDAAGRATGTAVGKATITATYLGFTDSASLTVTSAVPVSIAITPNPLNIPRNMVVQLTATLIYSDSTTLDVTTTAAWDSATPATATVTATGATGGRARGVAAGTVIISATAKGITGQITA